MTQALPETATGLDAETVRSRLARDGYNELPRSDHRQLWRIVYEVLRQPMYALLIAGGVVYLLLGDTVEAVLLMAFATFSVAITIVQDSRSERVLEALRDLASPRALVIREGLRSHIAARDLVRGDIIVVTEGDRVPADATLLISQELMVDESLLTGESVPVRKLEAAAVDAGAMAPSQAVPAGAAAPAATTAPTPGGEDSPALFAGTLIVRGTGTAKVHATGAHTEMGRIGRSLGTIQTSQAHLQLQLRGFVRNFALIGAAAGTLAVVLDGILRGDWLRAALSGIAVGMSLLPEEFPLVMAVFMAMGAWRISQARVLTRRASAIETLGAVTVICTDKTGTLTENRMSLVCVLDDRSRWQSRATGLGGDTGDTSTGFPAGLRPVLQAGLLASAADPVDPMDVAVHGLAQSALGADAENAAAADSQQIRGYGLRPDLFAVVNVVAHRDRAPVAYAKGAIEAIARLCGWPEQRLAEVRQQADALADGGVRVLAVARSRADAALDPRNLPDTPMDIGFEYLGLLGFADPVRNHVPAAVAEFRAAGIRVLMITGDYPATARAIGMQAGIDASGVLSGDEIEAMDDQTLRASVGMASVFARIRPNQKLRIVQALQANGEVVAMTGDGVNDAPAIKAADIGIAMGGRGTDVAREASAIVLLDDDFGAIVKTIRLGRRIYDNLRKAIEYIVAVHIPIAGLALLPLLLGLPMMLAPIHIAFLEMVIDPACSVVLEAEGEEDDLMKRPPRDPSQPLLLPARILWAVVQGLVVLAVLAGIMVTAARAGLPEGDLRALVFTSLVAMNMGLILVNRSFNASLVRAFLRPNRSMWILLGAVLLILVLSNYWPPFRSLFRFGPLHLDDLAVCAAAGLGSLLLLEGLKALWFGRAHRARAAAAQAEPTRGAGPS